MTKPTIGQNTWGQTLNDHLDTLVSNAGTTPGNVPIAKASGDGRAGVWEYIHNDTTGYLWHLLAGSSMGSPAALIAMGLDNSNGTGLLVANKAAGKGIVIDQKATISSATAYGIHATQSSTLAPLVRLEMNDNAAADVLQLLAFGTPGASQRLLYVSDPVGEVGSIFASDGRLRWQRDVRILNKASGEVATYLENSTSTSANSSNTRKAWRGAAGTYFFGATGSAGQYYCYRFNHTGSTFSVDTAPNLVSADPLNPLPSEPSTWTTVIGVKAGKLGLYTAVPVVQPARVGALTDSTTGTPTSTIGDVGAAFSQSGLNNIHASLLAKINAIEAKLSAAAGGIGVTA